MIPESTIRSLRAMAEAMREQTPMSADVLTMLTDDLESNGPISHIMASHPEINTPLFHLRALAGVKLLILTGRAPELAEHLKGLTNHLGDPAYATRTRNLFRRALLNHPDEIRSALDRPIQQHQPGRAGHLLRGLTMLAAPRVRLLELGACAGLNLMVDRYRWFGHGWEWGDATSPVRLATSGLKPGNFEIIHRAGCDIAPRDVADPQDAAILRSFIPPEREVEELELEDAMALVAGSGIRIEKADAVRWLREQLSRPVAVGTCTVVWHSLFWWYLSPEDQAAIEEILVSASRRMEVARICYEPYAWGAATRLQVITYP
ncbi:DUF2332 domain-containing protein [Streptomyces sp. NPDC006654]|uniref:DUF2332 domain-containing protein n=1 Tax=Streptomyces sp. NPDC006654 TaxID=3156897 RepID=UPI0033FE962B